MRVALDLLGGDAAPGVVVDGALLAADEVDGAHLLLVGPPDVAERELAARGCPGRFDVVPATDVVAMDEDPVRAVRRKRGATVRVATRLVRDGHADALVSAGSTGATVAAALFTLGTLPGVTRPGLAVVLPTPHGPLVLVDAGATVSAGPDLLVQFALAGAAYAATALGVERPRVGLLTNGEEPGKGDAARKEAHRLLGDVLSALPVQWVGNVEGRDVATGGPADVVVTDGLTGNVLLKGLEGAATAFATAVRSAADAAPEHAHAAQVLLTATEDCAVVPDRLGGAVLLGVDGVCVVGHGASSPRAVAECVRLAAVAARSRLVPRVAEALDGLVAHRRAAAGFDATR